MKPNTNRKFTPEVKRHFLEIISTYKAFREQMDRQSDIVTVAKTLGGIVEAAKHLTISEAGDWFDGVTIKRNMSELEKLDKAFDKVAVDAKALDERLSALYEDMGNILGRYYEISDIDTYTMKRRLGMKDDTITEGKLKELIKEEVRLNTLNKLNEGSGYTVYHNSYTSAIDAAISFAEKKGYIVSEDDVWQYISTGPKKPSEGKTNKFTVGLMKNGKDDRKKLHIQVYGMGRGRYELNMYIQ
jgi:uncharacterized protein YbcC (UPF0753/DUF2309 family)